MMIKRIVSRVFPSLVLAGLLFLAAPLDAQIRLETVTVLVDDGEALDSLGYFAPLMLTWSFENPPPPGARIEFLRGRPGTLGMDSLTTIAVSDMPGNAWGDTTVLFTMGAPMQAFPLIRSERYALVLLDAAGDAIGIMTSIHGTIFLRQADAAADFDPCTRTLVWRWDDYVYNDPAGGNEDPLTPFFNHIQLMVLPPGQTEEVVAATYDFDESLQMREAPYGFGDGPGPYYFRVRAVENPDGNGRVSYSNRRGFNLVSPAIDDPQIARVDVVDNQYIELEIELQGSVGDFEFLVYRSDQAGQGYELAGTLDAPVAGLNTFSDQAVPDLQGGKWHYLVEAFLRDAGCDAPAYDSPPVSSVFLAGEILSQSDDQLEVALAWEQVPAWDWFTLQRQLPDGDDWEDMDTFFDLPGYYADDLSPLMEGLAGEVRYRIIAGMGPLQVRSNEFSVLVEPRVFVPNVFNPAAQQPENRVFRPDFMGLVTVSMRLRIYNRWGQEVYSVNNPEDGWPGWDGTLSGGESAPAGMYAYTLEYQFAGSPQMEKRGHVLLLR